MSAERVTNGEGERESEATRAEVMTDEESGKAVWRNPLVRKVAVSAAALLVAFLLGLIPMWLVARDRAHRLAETRRELNIARLQNTLASAVIDARRAEYEAARRSASDFFTNLRAEVENEKDSSLTRAQRESVGPLFGQRDEIITLLARGDPAAADRLSDFYVAYLEAVGKRDG